MAKIPARTRPTKRCLTDLDLPLPDVRQPLDEIDHPVVTVAQAVPEQRDAGGAQRVLSLSDRIWYKVKTGDQRAVATELRAGEIPDEVPPGIGEGWIGAAGHRQADTPHRDFYEVIKRECTVGKTISSTHLLPTDWDWRRLTADRPSSGSERCNGLWSVSSPIADMKPSPGEIIWSTLFPSEVASAILELDVHSTG